MQCLLGLIELGPVHSRIRCKFRIVRRQVQVLPVHAEALLSPELLLTMNRLVDPLPQEYDLPLRLI